MQHFGLKNPVIKMIRPNTMATQSLSSLKWVKPIIINSNPRNHLQDAAKPYGDLILPGIRFFCDHSTQDINA